MKPRFLQILILSVAGIGSLALGIWFASYVASHQDSSQSASAPRARFSSLDEATNHLVQTLRRFHQKCAVIESKRFDARKHSFSVESSNTGGNPFLLYAYTEIYKYTQQKEYWQLAIEQARCLEQSIQPLIAKDEMYKHPWIKKSRGDKPEALAWGTYLHALSYFHKVNGSAPTYLKKIADFLANLDTNYKAIERVAQSEERRVRGLLRYYDLTKEQSYLEQAMKVMEAITVPPADLGTDLPGSPYVMAKYLRAYCELYVRSPTDWISYRIKEFAQATEAFMQSLQTHPDEGLVVLVYYQIAMAAEACWEATSEERFLRTLGKALDKEVKNITFNEGIVEQGERITLSLNAEISRALVKYTKSKAQQAIDLGAEPYSLRSIEDKLSCMQRNARHAPREGQHCPGK